VTRKVKYVYSPPLSDLCYDAFECVVIDEGVKMKGEDTLVGRGVRQLEPKYRECGTSKCGGQTAVAGRKITNTIGP